LLTRKHTYIYVQAETDSFPEASFLEL
jgi:hypothetical protein